MLPTTWREHLDMLTPEILVHVTRARETRPTPVVGRRALSHERYPRGYATQQIEPEVWGRLALPRHHPRLTSSDTGRAWVGDGMLAAHARAVCLAHMGVVDQQAVNRAVANATLARFMVQCHQGLLVAFGQARSGVHRSGTIFEVMYSLSARFRTDYWVWLTSKREAWALWVPEIDIAPAPLEIVGGSDAEEHPTPSEATSAGMCWRVLFADSETAADAGGNPRIPNLVWPSRSTLMRLAREHPLSGETFTLTRTGAHEYHVKRSREGVLTAWQVLALIEGDASRVGGERPKAARRVVNATDREVMRSRLAAGCSSTPGEGRSRMERLWLYFWAVLTAQFWQFAFAVTRTRRVWRPEDDGWCYLSLFAPHRRARVARLLGRAPYMRAIAQARPDYVYKRSPSRCLGVAHITPEDVDDGEVYPRRVLRSFWSHLATSHLRLGARGVSALQPGDDGLTEEERARAQGEEAGRERAGIAARPLPATPPGGDWVFGTFPGVAAATPPPAWKAYHAQSDWEFFEGPWARGARNYIHRPELTEDGWRRAQNATLHCLQPTFFDHVKSPGHLKERTGARETWEAARLLWFQFASALPTGARVVVTASNYAACEATAATPAALVPGATHGFVFAAALGDAGTAPGWSGALFPLEDHQERRWLAGLRLIPLVCGRTDIQIAIINGADPVNHPLKELGELLDVHPLLAAVSRLWVPVNLGATAARGCVLEPDADQIASSFAELGHYYGWDESVLYVRGPACWVKPANYACMPYKDGFTLRNVTWLERVWNRGFRAHTYSSWGVPEMREHLRGAPLRGDARHPGFTHNSPFKPLGWVLRERDDYLAERNIPVVQTGEKPRRLERAGGRYTTAIEAYDPDYPEMTENFAGNTWRGYDRCWGARNTAVTSVTQSIHPEIWEDLRNGSPGARGDLVRTYEAAARAIGEWTRKVNVPGEVIGVASVLNREQAEVFRSARGHLFPRWVFLTEGAGGEEGSDLFVQLPTTYGTGFSFQLARLLPGVFSPESAVFSCVNDLETDRLPREQRLEVGLRALEREAIAFPAMALNAPCPFQDVIFRGNAILPKKDSLFAAIAKWGWVYGVDEVWAVLQDYPTVAVQPVIHPCATARFQNPCGARLWVLEGEEVREIVTEGGAFRPALTQRGVAPEKERPVPVWRRVARALSFKRQRSDRPGLREWRAREWDWFGNEHVLRMLDQGRAVFTIFTWGTRGDVIPMRAAASKIAEGGVYVNLVHLCTPEEGRANLAKCESAQAHTLVPELMRLAAVVSKAQGPKIAPDYLTWDGNLAYSLRPGDRDATPPRGGLPKTIDWLVSLFYWKERAKVRVGVYRGAKWFPRSANGSTFLPERVVSTPRAPKKGRVGGSSTIPVPAEYADWEEITESDHFRAFQDYTEVACAGGAGVVQTIAAAGARAVAWDDSIDRRYREPTNAGRGVDGNEAPEKWWLLVVDQRPSLLWRYARLSPRRWWNYLRWVAWRDAWGRRAWHTLFMIYSLRFTHVLPTLEETVVSVFVRPLAGGVFAAMLRLLFALILKSTLAHAGYSLPRALWVCARKTTSASFSLPAALLTACGTHPLTSGAVVALAREICPSWSNYGVTWEFNRPLIIGQTSGVWLCLTPVWVGGVPLGIHAALWDGDTGEKVEGVHVTPERAPGSPFALTRRPANGFAPLLAVRTSLAGSALPTRRGPVAPYSALWNCQTMVAGIYLRHAPSLVLSELVVLLFWSGYAAFWLTIFTVVGVLAGSSATVALWAAVPLERAIPGIPVRAMATHMREATRKLTLLFAESLESVDEEHDFADTPPGSPERVASASNIQLRDAAALLCADAIRTGVDADIAFTAIARALPEATLAAETGDAATFSNVLLTELYRSRRGATDAPIPVAGEMVTDVVAQLVRGCRKLGVPLRVVESFAAILQAVLHGNFALMGEAVVWLAKVCDWMQSQGWLPGAAALAADLAERLHKAAPDELTRRKNAWAILHSRAIERLRRSDWLALSLQPTTVAPDTGDAVAEIARRLNEFAPVGQDPLDPSAAFVRPVYMPKRPRVAQQELGWPSLLESVAAQVSPELTKRVEGYLTLGGRPAIDGVWTATPQNLHASIERYLVPAAPLSDSDRDTAEQVAAALYDAHPEAFRAPGVVTPETVKRNLVMKYSPGLPFIGRFRTRAELVKTGWMDSIIQATYHSLDTGEYPRQAYHVFPKMMVLDADKLTRTPGKVRTIIAQDLASVFVDQVVQLERNKRTVWPSTDTGLGAPLTAAYLGRVFERVRERKNVFNADVTAFDANCPPVLYEVLTNLAELGAADGGIPAVAPLMRAKYMAMQSADLVMLTTGDKLRKLRGGATGQSATSWDNTWAFRAAAMIIWSDVTGRPFHQFYNYNTIHNTGDDNVWGTDSDLDPDALAEAAKRLLRMELRVEGRDRDGTLAYLSKIPKPTAEYADELAKHFPGREFGSTTVIHDLSRLLTRRAGLTTHVSGAPERSFRKALLERTLGHAMLTWHQPAVYSMLAEEWVEDAARYFGARAQKLVFERSRDEAGHTTCVRVRAGLHATLTPAEQARLKALQTSLKLPTYHKVLDVAYSTPGAKPLSPWAASTVRPSLEDVVRDTIVRARTSFHRWVPDELSKLSPNSSAAPLTRLFYTWGYPVEKFIWRTLRLKTEGELEFGEFAQAVRNSPYGAAADPVGFWWYQESPGVRELLLSESDLTVRGRVAMITAWYIVLTHVRQAARRLPLIGLIIESMEVYTRDAPKAFAVLNTLYWHEHASTSEVISSLLPKDPFATQKQAAAMLAALTPDFICAVLGPLTMTGLVGHVAEVVAALRRLRLARGIDSAGMRAAPNAWETHAESIATAAEANPEGVLIKSATATGKSTQMPAALLRARPQARVWLLLPRIVLRDEYRNPWAPEAAVVRLMMGVPDNGAPIAVCTYGHALARHSGGQGPTPDDFVIFDEAHENLPEMGVSFFTLPGKRIIASATPRLLFARDYTTMVLDLPRPYEMVLPTRLPLDPLGLWQEAKRTKGLDTSRALFILPTLAECEAVKDALLSAGEVATTLTSRSRRVAQFGHIVATNIVDTGITITPPPTLLVDSGETQTSHEGEVLRLATSPATDEQRRGRVGRLAAAAVFTTVLAGTGPDPMPIAPFSRLACLSPEVRRKMLEAYGAENTLTPVMEHGMNPSPLDPYMSIHLPGECASAVPSLAALWWLRCDLGSLPRANAVYDTLESTGWSEHYEGLRRLLRSHIGDAWLQPRKTLNSILATDPYWVVENGAARRASCVYYRRGAYRAA